MYRIVHLAILNLPEGDILNIWSSKVHQHVSVHIVATSCIDGINCLFPFYQFYQLLFGHIWNLGIPTMGYTL